MILLNLLLRFSFSTTEQCTVNHGYGEVSGTNNLIRYNRTVKTYLFILHLQIKGNETDFSINVN